MVITRRMHRALALIVLLLLSGLVLSALIGAPRQATSSQPTQQASRNADADCSARGGPARSVQSSCASGSGAQCLSLDALNGFVVEAPNAPRMGGSFVARLISRLLARQKSGVAACLEISLGQ